MLYHRGDCATDGGWRYCLQEGKAEMKRQNVRKWIFAAMLGLIVLPKAFAASQVQAFHWWVSDGEQASIKVIQRHVEAEGLVWRARAISGSGTATFGDVLRKHVEQGRAPSASQAIGYDIHDWARRGKLLKLDELAREQEWDQVVPYGIQHLSKYRGHWYAAPFNAHSTNWIWLNGARYRELNAVAPDTWEDLLQLLALAKAAGIIPIAIGRDAWEHTLLFEVVAAGAGGAEFYRKAFLELDADSLDDALLLRTFQRMSQLRAFIDPNFSKRSWNEATQRVVTGQALMQIQGSWVNGEFLALGYQAGLDFECFRFPDTQGLFLFNSDQYIFFKDGVGSDESRSKMASALMSKELQRDVNVASGAAPARVDVSASAFNPCGRQAIADLRSANMRRTLMGSIAMGNAHPAVTKQAIYATVSDHLYGKISNEQAVAQLKAAIAAGQELRDAHQ